MIGPMEDRAVQREPHYFGNGDHALFGWLHTAQAAERAGCVAVICPPIGSEYTYSHRTIRHLADNLARAGVPALRFDFHGSGDSPGSDLDADRVAEWRRNVAVAVRHARTATGCAAVCLVGAAPRRHARRALRAPISMSSTWRSGTRS
jgi:alpha/beta superfamily hydrolase